MSDIPGKIKQIIREELRGVYTVSICIVEEFDAEEMRVRVSLKRDSEAIMTVPVATPFAQTDGYGMVVPIASGDEGLLLHTKEEIEDLTVNAGHQDVDLGHVAFDINDALFFPRYWNDNDDKPVDVYTEYKKGDLLIAHGADTFIHIKGDEHDDPGTTTIMTASGPKITLDETTSEENVTVETDNLSLTLDDTPGVENITAQTDMLTLVLDDTSGAETITAETASGAGIKIEHLSGVFKLLDKSGHGFVSDGAGNITAYAATFDINDQSTTSL